MEYEIGDDPQGAPDMPEADRDGGIRENLFMLRGPARRAMAQADEEVSRDQVGELA